MFAHAEPLRAESGPEVDPATGRVKASVEAVDRRKRARAARTAMRRLRRRDEDDQRPAWEAQAVTRLIRNRVRNGQPILSIHRLYAYWQAVRCGWDVLQKEWREVYHPVTHKRTLLAPEETAVWVWWIALDWRTRDDVSEEKRRPVSVDATVSLSLCNPAFYVERQ